MAEIRSFSSRSERALASAYTSVAFGGKVGGVSGQFTDTIRWLSSARRRLMHPQGSAPSAAAGGVEFDRGPDGKLVRRAAP
jgi:hypothetical protein